MLITSRLNSSLGTEVDRLDLECHKEARRRRRHNQKGAMEYDLCRSIPCGQKGQSSCRSEDSKAE